MKVVSPRRCPAQERFAELVRGIRLPQNRRDFFQRILTPEQLALLDAECWDPVESWAKLHGVGEVAAALDLFGRMTTLPSYEIDWLRRELGIAPFNADMVLTPTWDSSSFELRLSNRLCRRIVGPKRAKNIVTILNAFEAAGWPTRIDNPFGGVDGPTTMQAAIGSLNHGINAIRFHADGTGKGIRWSVDLRRN